MNADKLKKLEGQVRTGGPGSVRRKKKAVHKSAAADEQKLTSTLKRLGVTNIPGIEEVSLFREDGTVIHFVNPKLQASFQSNTYVVAGKAEIKKFSELPELLPGFINQLGPDNLANLKKLAESLTAQSGATKDEEPEVENFEAVSNQTETKKDEKKPEAKN